LVLLARERLPPPDFLLVLTTFFHPARLMFISDWHDGRQKLPPSKMAANLPPRWQFLSVSPPIPCRASSGRCRRRWAMAGNSNRLPPACQNCHLLAAGWQSVRWGGVIVLRAFFAIFRLFLLLLRLNLIKFC